MLHRYPGKVVAALLIVFAAGLVARSTYAQVAAVDVAVFAINDFHGNLMPPTGGFAVPDPAAPGKTKSIAAGGAEELATMVKQLRAQHRNSIFVAAGDLIGASPLLSANFHDEPTIESLSLMGLEVSSVGNHEFDDGLAELRRMQDGGCHPVDGCAGPHSYTGAKFHYLAASTVNTATGKSFFPPYYIKRFDGIPVAFIGLTLKGTPEIVSPAGVAGLEFRDEAETVNALVPELRAQGIEAIIVLIHEGGAQSDSANYDGCTGMSGRITEIVPKLDKAVDVVVSGHTHEAYNCVIDGRLVTSAYSYGMMLSEIDLKLDPKTHDVISARAVNRIVRDDVYSKDQTQTLLLAGYQSKTAAIANRIVGTLTQPLSSAPNVTGESQLGDLIADAELAAANAPGQGGAVIAFMNPGGIRTNLTPRAGGSVTHGDVFAVQPFGNTVVTLTLTGVQIKSLLEQQFSNPALIRILQISAGFSYTWDAARPPGDMVLANSITLNGTAVRPEAIYRVATISFLATGGDGFAIFRDGANVRPVMTDIDATEAYLAAHPRQDPPALTRIQRRN